MKWKRIAIFILVFWAWGCTRQGTVELLTPPEALDSNEEVGFSEGDKASEDELGLPGYQLSCQNLLPVYSDVPQGALACFVGDEKQKNAAILPEQIEWQVQHNDSLRSAVRRAEPNDRWHATISIDGLSIEEFAKDFAAVVVRAKLKTEQEEELSLVAHPKSIQSDIFELTPLRFEELLPCSAGMVAIGSELLQTRFYQDYINPRIDSNQDQWIWSHLNHVAGKSGVMTPLKPEIYSEEGSLEFRNGDVYDFPSGMLLEENRDIAFIRQAIRFCTSQENHEGLLANYLPLTGSSGFPMCAEYIYGEIFTCGEHTCAKSDPGYVNICQLPEQGVERAPSGYPYCGEQYFGDVFSCKGQLCAKSDPEYKNICELKSAP